MLSEINRNEGHSQTMSPLIVEREGRRLAVFGLTDLDGTANDETIPESQRLGTIGPAIETVTALQARNISVGIITGRSFGEALLYQEALGATGFTICEDGAVVVLPQGSVTDANKQEIGARLGEDKVTRLNGYDVLLLSQINRASLSTALSRIPNLITTLSAPPEEIQKIIGHSTPEAARLSADRLASCYVANPTPEQVDQIHAEIERLGLPIRTFGWTPENLGPLHLIGTDAHKGHAIRTINENAELFLPGAKNINGVLPIAFGNNTNDLKLFTSLTDMGGIGILVGKPGGGYYVDESSIPSDIIKSEPPAGLGMKAALPEIFRRIGIN